MSTMARDRFSKNRCDGSHGSGQRGQTEEIEPVVLQEAITVNVSAYRPVLHTKAAATRKPPFRPSVTLGKRIGPFFSKDSRQYSLEPSGVLAVSRSTCLQYRRKGTGLGPRLKD